MTIQTNADEKENTLSDELELSIEELEEVIAPTFIRR